MSLLPALLNELIEDLNNLNRPTRYLLGDLYDQHFGLGLPDLATTRLPHLPALRAGYLRPWRNIAAPETGVSSIKANDNEFTVSLDVSHFKPEELNVQVDDSGYVVIEGKHEERGDEHGLIFRHFIRRYKLPENVEVNSLASSLSTDGVLSIKAAKRAVEAPNRTIKIVQTHQPSPAVQSQTSTVEKAPSLEKKEEVQQEAKEEENTDDDDETE